MTQFPIFYSGVYFWRSHPLKWLKMLILILIYLVTITSLPFLLLRIKGQNIYHQIGNFTFLKFHLFEEKTTQLPYLEVTSWASLYKRPEKDNKMCNIFNPNYFIRNSYLESMENIVLNLFLKFQRKILKIEEINQD